MVSYAILIHAHIVKVVGAGVVDGKLAGGANLIMAIRAPAIVYLSCQLPAIDYEFPITSLAVNSSFRSCMLLKGGHVIAPCESTIGGIIHTYYVCVFLKYFCAYHAGI